MINSNLSKKYPHTMKDEYHLHSMGVYYVDLLKTFRFIIS